MNCQTALGRPFAAKLTRVLFAGAITAGAFASSSTSGALISFTFADGAYSNGTATAFDSNGNAGNIGSYMLVDGVTLTSVAASAPAYIESPDDTYNWEGDFTPATTNFPGSLGQLAISNPDIGGTNDSNAFNPQESWTVKFDAPIIFRTLDARRFDEADTMRVTFGMEEFNFADGAFDSSDNKADPFGSSLVIPANTNITFTNSRTYPSFPLTGSNPSGGDNWGLQGFVVETVEIPEPTAILLIFSVIAGLSLTNTMRNSRG